MNKCINRLIILIKTSCSNPLIAHSLLAVCLYGGCANSNVLSQTQHMSAQMDIVIHFLAIHIGD